MSWWNMCCLLRNSPPLRYNLKANKLLEVATSSVCAAVIDVARVKDDELIFTAVPIVYGSYHTPAGTTVLLEPPRQTESLRQIPHYSASARFSRAHPGTSGRQFFGEHRKTVV